MFVVPLQPVFLPDSRMATPHSLFGEDTPSFTKAIAAAAFESPLLSQGKMAEENKVSRGRHHRQTAWQMLARVLMCVRVCSAGCLHVG